jgi:hypothetical protein
MIDKFLLSALAFILFTHPLTAQTDQWTTVRFGTLQCEFPAAYSPIDFAGAGGIYYDGGNVYLTVTAQPDTSSMKGNLDRDYTREFMNVVLDVSRKLNGRVREFRDTVIGNMPGYISMMEISLKDGRKSNYELIQVLHQDTMRSFSAQYFIGDNDGVRASQRLFGSIAFNPNASNPKMPGKLGIWIGAALLLVFGAWALLRKGIFKAH